MLLVSCLPTGLYGQTAATARISGIVTDANGAVVPGAAVKLVDRTTKAEQNTVSNGEGLYTFANIDPASYDLSVTAQGFKTAIISDLKADVSVITVRNVALEPGNVSEQVTVTANSDAVLQTEDAAIGTVINRDRLQRLPNATRVATDLFTLQPGVTSTGEAAGARADQNVFNLDGLDVSDNVGFRGSSGTVVPIPSEGVEEFRSIVTNPNATFGRAAGAQVTLIGRRGGNQFHGSGYEYHQNRALNANSWNNNRLRLPKPQLISNLFGATVSGPILEDKLFFFFNYEGLRRPGTQQITRIVPTASLRSGVLRFADATGAIQTINPRTAMICGATGNGQCDPRGLGASPLVQSQLNALPLPNAGGGDGLNTGSFTTNLPSNLKTDYGLLRFDYQINQKWSFDAKGSFYRSIQPGGGQANLTTGQFADKLSQRPKTLLFALTGIISNNMVNELRVGRAFDNFNLTVATVAPPTGFNIAVDILGISEPLDFARAQSLSGGNTEFLDNVTWTKGTHTIQFGGNVRLLSTTHFRNDKFGIISTPQALVGNGGSFIFPAAQRPPTCGGAVTTNCIRSSDQNQYNNLYSALLGIVDSARYLATRDANLQPNPVGTGLSVDTSFRYYEFYVADTWKVKPSLSLSYGLQYQWFTPPVEKSGQQTVLVYRDTGRLVDPADYVRQRQLAAESGDIFNPDVGYSTLKAVGRKGAFDTDFKDFSPRISAAWSPSFKGGFFGRIIGDKQTVIRGGYALLYDRLNTVSSVVLPVLGVGFAQTLTRANPLNGASQQFRVGVDGSVLALPVNSPVTSPIVPSKVFGLSTAFGELLSLNVDPNIRTPRNHQIDFTYQRELPHRLLLEVGYIGRFGQRLFQDTDLNSAPYFFKDRASGQRFSEAFDAVATQIRNGQAVTTQQWFENQLPGVAAIFGFPPGTTSTQALAIVLGSQFRNGDVGLLWNIFLDGLRDFLGRPPFNNRQVGGQLLRTSTGHSSYNAMFVSLHQRLTHGLTFDLNYTLSKSLDQIGLVQNGVATLSSAFSPDIDYGPSFFDARHVFNANGVYDLPFGKGRRFSTGNKLDKLIGGWYVAGIFRASSGLPLTVFQGGNAFGGNPFTSVQTGAILIGSNNFGNSVRSGVNGSGLFGTNGNPSIGGSGLSIFADPAAAASRFRRALLSQDGRQGRGTLRGFPFWNVDLSLGKTTKITERLKFSITADFFNAFNKVNFFNPGLNLADPSNFGVVTGAFGARRIQVGGRLEF